MAKRWQKNYFHVASDQVNIKIQSIPIYEKKIQFLDEFEFFFSNSNQWNIPEFLPFCYSLFRLSMYVYKNYFVWSTYIFFPSWLWSNMSALAKFSVKQIDELERNNYLYVIEMEKRSMEWERDSWARGEQLNEKEELHIFGVRSGRDRIGRVSFDSGISFRRCVMAKTHSLSVILSRATAAPLAELFGSKIGSSTRKFIKCYSFVLIRYYWYRPNMHWAERSLWPIMPSSHFHIAF